MTTAVATHADINAAPGERMARAMLIEQRYGNEKRGYLLIFALWFFLGLFGAHRFYAGKIGTGILMILLLITGITFLWWIVDAFLMMGWINKHNEALRTKITLATIV